MKNCYYAAYELQSGKELCIGVWDSMEELGAALKISVKAAYSRMYRNRKSRSPERGFFSVKRIPSENEQKCKKKKTS